jgi:hypothetical protein
MVGSCDLGTELSDPTALLERSPVVRLLKNFPAFYGTRWFIAVFTRTLKWSPFWARSIESIPHHPIFKRSPQKLEYFLRRCATISFSRKGNGAQADIAASSLCGDTRGTPRILVKPSIHLYIMWDVMLTLLARIRDVLGSNLGRDNGYPESCHLLTHSAVKSICEQERFTPSSGSKISPAKTSVQQEATQTNYTALYSRRW